MLCAVQHFDTDGDGYITKEELARALSPDTDSAAELRKDIQQVLHEADRNHDDRIDYTVSSASAQPCILTSSWALAEPCPTHW